MELSNIAIQVTRPSNPAPADSNHRPGSTGRNGRDLELSKPQDIGKKDSSPARDFASQRAHDPALADTLRSPKRESNSAKEIPRQDDIGREFVPERRTENKRQEKLGVRAQDYEAGTDQRTRDVANEQAQSVNALLAERDFFNEVEDEIDFERSVENKPRDIQADFVPLKEGRDLEIDRAAKSIDQAPRHDLESVSQKAAAATAAHESAAGLVQEPSPALSKGPNTPPVRERVDFVVEGLPGESSREPVLAPVRSHGAVDENDFLETRDAGRAPGSQDDPSAAPRFPGELVDLVA